MQYVDFTTDKFRLKWNNYKDNDWKTQYGEERMQPQLFEHFQIEEHNEISNDSRISLIDKRDVLDPTRWGKYWCTMLKTVTPYRMNSIE